MRLIVVLGLGALVLAACQKKSEEAAKTGEAAPAAAAAAPAGPPKLKAGFWTQKISSMGSTQEVRFCLDDATAAQMNLWGAQTSQEMCAKNVVTPIAGGWSFESECDLGPSGKTVTKGTAIGDLGSSYVVKATSTTTGAAAAQMNGTREMQVNAVWAAQCPAGMKPGDMALPGGVTMNLSQVQSMQKQAAGK